MFGSSAVFDPSAGDLRSEVRGQGGSAPLAARHGPVLAGLCAEELRNRLPRIQAAAAAGDLSALRIESHALRGVAANFGLAALAGRLLALETALRAGDRDGLREALDRLPAEVAAALAALGQG